MSPEQIEGDPVDFRSDIYSLGIMAYEMFTGLKPFTGNDLMAVMKMHAETDLPDPTLLVPDLPPAIKNFILKACAKSPDQRYVSMYEILEELSLIAESLNQDISPKTEFERDITVLLISHRKDQNLALNKLLDEFSQRAEREGLTFNIAGKTQIT